MVEFTTCNLRFNPIRYYYRFDDRNPAQWFLGEEIELLLNTTLCNDILLRVTLKKKIHETNIYNPPENLAV